MDSLSPNAAEKSTRSEINSISKSAVLLEVGLFTGLPKATRFLMNQIMWVFAGPLSRLILLAGLTIYLRFVNSDGLIWV